MKRLFETVGSFLFYLLAAGILAVYLTFGINAVLPDGGLSGVPLSMLFAVLVLAMLIVLWRWSVDWDDDRFFTAGDTLYNPLAPGNIAKDNWEKAIDRLPDGDDEDDDDA